jgi:hypothetical protein
LGDFEILEQNRWTNLARQGECLIVNVIRHHRPRPYTKFRKHHSPDDRSTRTLL